MQFGSAHSDEIIAKQYFQGEIGKSVLVNKLGITNQEQLEKAEAYFVEYALMQGLSAQARVLSPDGLKQMHKELFGAIYVWAGEYRHYTTGRGLPFCRPEFIAKSLDKLYQELNQALYEGMDKTPFIKISARFIGELNAIHPFIDGNGRTQRESLLLIAEKAGLRLTINEYLSQKIWYQAAEESHLYARYHGFENIIKNIIYD